MTKPAALRLTQARARMIVDHPFFGSLALRLKLVEMPAAIIASMTSRGMMPTLAVNGKNVYYHSPFIDTLSDQEVIAAVAHEVGHCVFDHIGRRGQRDPVKWNMAGDYVINEQLKGAGMTLGKSWLLEPKYFGMTSDHIYSLLPEPPAQGGGGALCDIMDGSGDAAEDKLQANDWKIATVQAANIAKQEGKLPANMQRFLDEMLNAKVDWRAQLRRFVTQASKNDFSWMRPNRRYLASGIFLPSLYSESMGEICIDIDTSGSIDQKTLNAFGAEISSIRDTVRPELTRVIYCDSHVNGEPVEFLPEDVLKLEMRGGGGTSFLPPFELRQKRNIQPVCSIYLTDGYGPFPSSPPDYPVIWVMTTNVKPPWGEYVQIEV